MIVHIEPKSLRQIWQEEGYLPADLQGPDDLIDAAPEEMDVAIDLGLKTLPSDGVTPQPKAPFMQTRHNKEIRNPAKLLEQYEKGLRKQNLLGSPSYGAHMHPISNPIFAAFGSVLAQIDKASKDIYPQGQKQGIFERHFFEGLIDNSLPNTYTTYGWDHRPVVRVHDDKSLGRTRVVPVVFIPRQNLHIPPPR